MGSQIVQIAFIILLSVFSIHICHGFSASHQHQVTYSESDDETHYGYRSSPLSVSYDDDDSYGAEESSSGPRVITGSGRMTILDKRSSQETSTKNQPEIVSRSKSTNNDQQQQQQQQSNGQNDQSMGPAITNYHVEWTESIDHGPSKSSSKSSLTPGQPQPQLFQSQMQPQFPVNNGYSAYPGHSSSSVSDNYKEYVDTQPIGYNYKGQQFSEPSVGYSESRIDSEWQFPDFMKELKRTEKDEKKDKDKVKKEDKKAEYEEDHWYQEPAKEKEEVKKEEKEEKKDDKFEFDWSDPWSEKPKEEKKRPKKNVDKEEKQKKEKYGDKLKKEDDEEGKVVKHEHHTHHHHDHWDDSWNSEPKKEKEKEKKKVEEYKETYDNGKKNDESYSGVKNPTVQDGDSWYDAPKKEEKYQEPSKKEEEAKGEYYSENDYQKNQDDKYYENKQHDKNQYNKDQYDNSQQNNDQNDNHQYDNNQYDDGQYGNNQYDDNQHSDNAKHEDKQYDDKYYEDKPAEGGLESPEQIGRRPGDSKDKGGKGGLLESYFWKALPGGDKKDSTYNYVIHVSKIDLDKAYEKKDVKDEKMKDDY